MTCYNSLCTLIRGINEFLSFPLGCLCHRTEERWETSYPVPNSDGPFVTDLHWQTDTQQFPRSYDTSSSNVSRYTFADPNCVTIDLAYATRYSEARIHLVTQVEENSRGKGSHYYRYEHRCRERLCSLDEDLNTHGIQNNSRPQQRSSKRRPESERRQRRGHIDNGGSSMQATLSDISPRRLPRERSGILSVNADDISNSSHEAVSGRRTKVHRVRFA